MPQPAEERLSQHDREIASIRKLVLTGMKMLVKMEKDTDRRILRTEADQDALRKDLRQLAGAQRETDRMLKGLIRSLERGRNGHA